jgi:TRAP-type C4-dicarboxylate transport system permease small subunit
MVFFIAMGGAALAAQRLRMIGMDVLSRFFSRRTRALVRLLHTVLVLFICYLVVTAGLKVRAGEAAHKDDYVFISRQLALLALPVGTGLIGFHYLLHSLIDLSYLLRGREPPEEAEMPLH